MDQATAEAAGLSAAPDQAPESVADPSTPSDKVANDKAKADIPSGDASPAAAPAPAAVPPGRREPSPFFLFAAGLIGALLALVLMFLASITGLFSLSDGRVDQQAAALAALDERVRAVEADTADLSSFDPTILEPLQRDIAVLQEDLQVALSDPVSDGGPVEAPLDIDALIADAVAPLAARIDDLQTALQVPQGDAAAAGSGAPADPVLADTVAGLGSALDALRSDLETVRTSLDELAVRQDAVPPETGARLDALDGLVADASTQLAGLGETLGELSTAVESVEVRLGAMTSDITALAEAPVAQAPDRMARLGVALDAVVSARDAGEDVSMALEAAAMAASFDGTVSSTLAPVIGGQVDGALDTASLQAMFDAAYDAMRAAAPARETGGLLGALEDRARQMVTIRAPEGSAVLGEGTDPLAQLDRLGALIAAERFEAARAVATALPAGMQQAGNGLIDSLHARVALDDALANARHALLRALSESESGPDGAASQ